MITHVFIISAYGRGYWLAHQLSRKLTVTIVDISRLMPALSSADREGPFGTFVPEDLSPPQKKYLYGDDFYSIPQGFSILNEEGPIEFRGPLRDFHLEKRKDFRLCHAIHKTCFEQGSVSEIFLTSRVDKKAEDLWLTQLTAEITNSHLSALFDPSAKNTTFSRKLLSHLELSQAQKKQAPTPFLPCFSEYIFREPSQRYFSQFRESLAKKGVQFLLPVQEQDKPHFLQKILPVNKKKGNKIAIVWTLSGLETARHFSKYLPLLFPKWEKPAKIWLRFPLSCSIKGTPIPSILLIPPSKVFWSKRKTVHSPAPSSVDFMVLKQNPSARLADLWVLCPYSDCSHPVDLEKLNPTARKPVGFVQGSALEVFPSYKVHKTLEDSNKTSILELALKQINDLLLNPTACSAGSQVGGQEYFALYKKPCHVQKSFFREKGRRAWPVFHLNPEGTGKIDSYSLMLQSQQIAQSILSAYPKV